MKSALQKTRIFRRLIVLFAIRHEALQIMMTALFQGNAEASFWRRNYRRMNTLRRRYDRVKFCWFKPAPIASLNPF